ncbi:polysaccharide deacetylase family protein [Flavobacterium caeni]|uniref:Polysaccharide deacetylase n=1 Tax=Flavobacterium caeni TaxID=490189 RepID=A0A1G5FIQ2_9FLAO|nr:polysaccharide deacetylase family protein [Flavobacterium caeni]SCY39149.1 Polysaccharide deacetylase [Flavobacterium caeni]
MPGKFVISLDFELHWGAAEKWDLHTMRGYFDATRQSIPVVLQMFEKYGIHATWATVGFLFAKNKQQLLEFCPKDRPTYKNPSLSYYNLIDNGQVGEDESDDPYHYAPSLIQKILDTPHQELGTHTFAHYYCNESGQTEAQFAQDLQAAQTIAKANFNVELQSLVYPRNQFNAHYLEVAKTYGIRTVRTNPDVWFWNTASKIAPIARAFDTLLPISGTLTFDTQSMKDDGILLQPASRFLRPYTQKEKIVQGMKMNRIKSEMRHAAQNARGYHLWWHPHNFGYSTDENLRYLEEILQYFQQLQTEFGFGSASMIEMCR